MLVVISPSFLGIDSKLSLYHTVWHFSPYLTFQCGVFPCLLYGWPKGSNVEVFTSSRKSRRRTKFVAPKGLAFNSCVTELGSRYFTNPNKCSKKIVVLCLYTVPHKNPPKIPQKLKRVRARRRNTETEHGTRRRNLEAVPKLFP